MQSEHDETLPNFKERKHPRKGERKKQWARTKKSMQANMPKEVCHTKVKEPLRDENL